MSVNNLFEVAFVRRGERGTPAVAAYTWSGSIKYDAACERSEFSSVVSMELKSVVWTDFRKTGEV